MIAKIFWIAAGVAAMAGSAGAADRVVSNPRLLGAAAPKAPQAPTAALNLLRLAPTVGVTGPGEAHLELKVTYTDGRIYNPATQRYDHVHLRSYNGDEVSPDTPYVAPTIEVHPGDTVRIGLDNELPADPSCDHGMAMDAPHCFNGTNLHAHGLWVSPTGNSDNVLLSINPGASFEYEYNIPRDHPAGTYWYHTHRHGSTALQVSSGMAGALIVRGDRAPTETRNGDLETLLYQDRAPIPEQVLLFQQIQYACLDADGNIKVAKDAKGKVIAWVCDPGDVGVIETYGDKNGNGFGPLSWGQSGRYTSINGQVLGTLEATAGRLERWRLIHAGIRDTIALEFYHMTSAGSRGLGALKPTAQAAFRNANCVGDPVPFYIVASDGLTAAQARKQTRVTLQPGYRDDLLVVFPAAGDYCMVNAAVAAEGSVSEAAMGPRLLGKVSVAKGQDVSDPDALVTRTLVEAAESRMPEKVRDLVVADLKAGLKLSHFTSHVKITDAEVAGEPKQELTFHITVTPGKPPVFEVGSQDYAPRPYDPGRIDRTLLLGHAQEWVLRSTLASHPFHIHVNPFQVVAILDPNGKDVSAPGAVDDYGGGAPDPQYPGLKDAWKDTLWVKSFQRPDGTYAPYTIIVRTRYERYIGEFVLHCHILDHEDQGMMQNVRIVLPGSEPMAMSMAGAH